MRKRAIVCAGFAGLGVVLLAVLSVSLYFGKTPPGGMSPQSPSQLRATLLLARQTAILGQTETSGVFHQDTTNSGYMVLKDNEVIWTAELTHDYQFGGTSTPETVVFATNGAVRPEGYEIDILSQEHRTRLRIMIDGAGFVTTTLENLGTRRQRN